MTFRIPVADAALRADILDLSRQNNLHTLSPWFAAQLDAQIVKGRYLPEHSLTFIMDSLVHRLTGYRIQTGTETVVLGMSGGVDSAVVAALFKRAGYRVIGFTLPIHQNPEETERGIETCRALGLEHMNVDLTELYDATLKSLGDFDLAHEEDPDQEVRVRRGNVRARLRMITLYNWARKLRGFVASTDNWSELVAGFWTVHGDVGDVAPIQSLLKSWEVPALARRLGVPEATWRATPTDGLAVLAGGDEAQLGATYLEWDLMVLAIQDVLESTTGPMDDARLRAALKLGNSKDLTIFNNVTGRIGGSWFKRKNPLNFDHPMMPRLQAIDDLDLRLFVPPSAR
jgi:NAD+ synthetase